MILAKIMIKWRVAVCEAQGSPKGPKLMIKGIKEAQGRLREAQGTEKALKGTTSVLEAGLTPTGLIIFLIMEGLIALFNQQFLACSYFSLHFQFFFSTKLSNISPGVALSGNHLTISFEMNTGEIINSSSVACTEK